MKTAEYVRVLYEKQYHRRILIVNYGTHKSTLFIKRIDYFWLAFCCGYLMEKEFLKWRCLFRITHCKHYINIIRKCFVFSYNINMAPSVRGLEF